MKIQMMTPAQRTAAENYADGIDVKESQDGSRDQRRADRTAKRWWNAYHGKLAEFAVQSQIGGRTDDAIYATGSKTVARFEVDIFADAATPLRGLFGTLNNFVKACCYDARRLPDAAPSRPDCDSWMIDPSDPVCHSPSPRDVVHLVYVDMNGRQVKLLGFVFAEDLRDDREGRNLWKPCQFIAHKVAVYMTDLAAAGVRIYGYAEADLAEAASRFALPLAAQEQIVNEAA